jgi:molecular chaperone GrpE
MKPHDNPAPAENQPPAGESRHVAGAADDQQATGQSADGQGAQADRIAQLERALQDAESRLLRNQAELENFRKRIRRDTDEQLRYAGLGLMYDLLSVLDNLSRAIDAARQGAGDSSALVDGVRLVAEQMRSVLEKHNCRRIPADGELFDPNYHAAIGQIPTREVPPGIVVQVAQEGYQLHDRVIRPAQVFVSCEPPDSEDADNP